ncbi:MAG: hypothetical protein Fues2KO_19780 [Fuerstiella sp.]
MFAGLAFGKLIARAEQTNFTFLVTQLRLVFHTIDDHAEDILGGHTNQRNSFCLNVGRTTMSQVGTKATLKKLRESHKILSFIYETSARRPQNTTVQSLTDRRAPQTGRNERTGQPN